MRNLDNALLYDILHNVRGQAGYMQDWQFLVRDNPLAKRIIETYPNRLPEFQIDDRSLSSGVADDFGKWAKDVNFYEKLTTALIDSRAYGDSFLVLEGHGELSSPLSLPPENLEVFSILTPKEFPILCLGVLEVHASRVLHFCGLRTFHRIYSQKDYWRSRFTNAHCLKGCEETLYLLGLQPRILNRLIVSSSQFLLGQRGLASMLYQAEESGDTELEANLRSRAATLNEGRDIDSILFYDPEQEEISVATVNNSGVPDIVDKLREHLSIVSGIPRSILFQDVERTGISSGMQNQVVQRVQEDVKILEWGKSYVLPQVSRLIQLFGECKVSIPLATTMTPVEIIENEKNLAERNRILIESGIVSPEEVRELYRQNLAVTPVAIPLDDALFNKSKASSPVPLENLLAGKKQDEAVDPEINLYASDWDDLLRVDQEVFDDLEERAGEHFNALESKDV